MRCKAQRVVCLRLQNSEFTEPKFNKFLTDVEVPSAVLLSFHPLMNASAQNECGARQFSLIRAKNRLP